MNNQENFYNFKRSQWTWSSERSNERNIFPNSILFKNIVPNTNRNKYYKFLKILYYFQYKPTNILIPFLIKKAIKKIFRSFERSELQAHTFTVKKFT